MRLSCPACQTEYEVPDAALTGRARTLRCGNCDHQWQVAPLAAATAGAVPAGAVPAGAVPAGAVPAGAEFVSGMPLPEPPPPRAAELPGQQDPLRQEPPRPEAPRPVMTAERPPTPVSFVPEPPAPSPSASKRKFPIPDPPGTEPVDRFDRKSTTKLTYDKPGYEYPGDLPVPRPARQGANPWLVSFLILLIAVVMVWVERVHIMQVWPPSTRLFNAITALLGQFLPHK